MEFITSNTLIITIFVVVILLLAIRYYLRKNKKQIFVEDQADFYTELGLTEESGAINEHFQFPESKDSMSDRTFNKFKSEQVEKESLDDLIENNDVQGASKVVVNELDKLKKDYKETSEDIRRKSEKSFSIDFENGILSHEILKKRNKKH